jgi:hypothetical protein
MMETAQICKTDQEVDWKLGKREEKDEAEDSCPIFYPALKTTQSYAY